jgi:hypothetical protein
LVGTSTRFRCDVSWRGQFCNKVKPHGYVKVRAELELYFYLEFPVHVSNVKQNIAIEEILFVSLHGGLQGDTQCGLQRFVLAGIIHPFHIWSSFRF